MNILLLCFGIVTLVEIIILVSLLKRVKRKNEISKEAQKETKTKSVEVKSASKKEKFDIKKLKPEQWIVFVVYAIAFGIFAYFFIGSIIPKGIVPIENSFVIDADSLQVFDKLSSFYIDKDNVLGSKEIIDEQTVRKIASAEAFNLVLKPKTIISEGTNAELNINLVGVGSNVYLNDKAIIPDLTNYELVKDYGNEAVYLNKDAKKYYSNLLISSDDAQDFVYRNFPGASVYSFADSKSYVPKLDDYRQTWTKIDTTIRNHLKLAVYAEGELYIDFVKQDLDQTIGKDEYTVEIKDQEGKSYFKELYEDDGDASDSNKIGEEQDFKIRVKDLPRGVYYVTFTRDKYNKWEDSTIKNIDINSNKILLLGTLTTWNKISFYTKISSPREILFQTYWQKGNVVKVSGDDSEKVTLKESAEKYSLKLDPGEYFISNDFGKFNILQNPGMSLTNFNWFDLPMKNEGSLNNQDVIIINKTKLKIVDGNISFNEKVVLNKDTKFKLQFINEDKLYLKEIQLKIK